MRMCIFCGQKAKSVEHAWPQWLLALITDPNQPSRTEAQFGPEGPVLFWDGPEITIKCLCKRCNNGWLSSLEGDAKLILRSLINDIALPLTSVAQSLLSRWSVKTAMVFDTLNRKRFYSDVERQQLRTSRALPPNTKIWLGRYGQSNLLSGEARHLQENKSSDRNPFGDGYVTTFVARRLVIQVLTVQRKPEFKSVEAILHSKAGPWDRSLIEVWPATDRVLKWPPVLSFSNAMTDLTELSGRFVAKR